MSEKRHIPDYDILIWYYENGITDHRDLGSDGENYLDYVKLGPFEKWFKFPKKEIDLADSPCLKRIKFLKDGIKQWHEELIKIA